MGRFVCKFEDGDKAYYLEWSTVVDAPLTFGMSLEEFKDYYLEEYGRRGMEREFDERMARVEKKGTSSRIHKSVDDLIVANEAGREGGSLTKEQIVEGYCRNREEALIPLGEKGR